MKGSSYCEFGWITFEGCPQKLTSSLFDLQIKPIRWARIWKFTPKVTRFRHTVRWVRSAVWVNLVWRSGWRSFLSTQNALVDDTSDVTSASSLITGQESLGADGSSVMSSPSRKAKQLIASQHRFTEWSFAEPHKCQFCTSLMMGMQRQGVVCQVCQYTCHQTCMAESPPECPIPTGQSETQKDCVMLKMLCIRFWYLEVFYVGLWNRKTLCDEL